MLIRRSLPLSGLLALSLFVSQAYAQSAAAPAQPTTTTGSAQNPPLPDIEDPMLVPVPPPKHVLESWKQGLALVRDQSASLRTALAQIEQARAQAIEARSPAMPTLSGGAALTRHLLRHDGVRLNPTTGMFTPTSIPDPAQTWNAGLTLSVPLFVPKAWYDHGTAKDNIAATQLSAKDTERLIVAAVANAIVSVVTTERLAEVSRVSLKWDLATLELNKRRAALGAASALDVLRADQEVSLSRAQIVTTDETLRQAREALGTTLGSAEDWGVTPQISLDGLSGEAQTICHPETDLSARTDVRAAASAAEVAERRVKSVDYGFLPTVSANSSLTYFSNQLATANGEHVTWTIGGVLSWQIYDGGLRYGQKAEARSILDQATIQLRETKRAATLQVTQAVRAVSVSQANLAVSKQSRDLAVEAARLSKLAFLNGSGTSFDLVDSARKQREAELDLAVKEFEVLRTRVAAILAMATCDI